jgi:hypothetical protein
MKYIKSLKLIIIFCFLLNKLYAVTDLKITGILTNVNHLPVAYANLAIFTQKDSSLLYGSTSNQKGKFNLSIKSDKEIFLKISCIGYQSHQININSKNKSSLDLGCIILKEQIKNISEVNIIGEKLRAKQGINSTEYFINRKLQKSSLKSIELLQAIPGLQVDFLQRLTYQGHQNILLLVNGSKRDLSYLQLLDAQQIDMIKFTPHAGATYSSKYQSVIHIYLKKKKTNSYYGHFYSEIPTHKDKIYAFPSASFNLQQKKLTISTNYSSELSYFPIHKNNKRSFNEGKQILNRKEEIDQNNWLHRFQTSINYEFSPKTILHSHFKWEKSSNTHKGVYSINDANNKTRKDIFNNKFFLSSLFLSHQFNKAKLSVDLYQFQLRSKTVYRSEKNNNLSTNGSRPKVNCFIGNINCTFPIHKKIKTDFGINYNRKKRKYKGSPQAGNLDQIYSVFSELKYRYQAFHFLLGGRFEAQKIEPDKGITQKHNHFLGNFSLKYQIHKKHSITLLWNQKIQRANLFHFNTTENFIDDYTIISGNPDIQSCRKNWSELCWQHQFNNQFLSFSVFHHRIKNSIELLRLYPKKGFWKQIWNNTGDINQLGIQINSHLKLGSKIQIAAQLQVLQSKTHPNSLAKEHGAYHQTRYGCKTSISCTYAFEKNYTLNFSLGYSALKDRIQYRYYEAPLYSFNLNKEFSKKWSIGLTTVIPLQKDFVHFAQKYYTKNYHESTKEKVILNRFPFWFKLKYSFGFLKNSSSRKPKNVLKNMNLKKGF